MSALLGQQSTGLGTAFLQQSDDRAVSKHYQWDYAGTRAQIDPWADGMLWPRPRGLGEAYSLIGMDSTDGPKYESDMGDCCGGSQRKKIIGTTKDANGTLLGSCIVQGYVTATDTYVGEVTSDSGGYYELCTSYAGSTHYLVAYKAGSPDVAGTTVNTIVPT